MTTTIALNLTNTYLGFTKNLKPHIKQRTENTLDKLIRYNGNITTYKEYVYTLLQTGRAPAIEHGVSHFSRRTGDYTKPKTVYSLDGNGWSSEINKTCYDFACYIVSTGFLDADKAAEYIQQEEDAKRQQKEREALQAAKESAEREAKQKQQEEEKENKRAERERKIEDQVNAITEDEKANLNSIVEHIKTEYADITSDTTADYIFKWACERVALDRVYPEAAVSDMKYHKELVSGKDPNSKNEVYVKRSNITYDLRRLFFGVTLGMSSQMQRKLFNGVITAEEADNRYQQAERTKQRQQDQLETFHKANQKRDNNGQTIVDWTEDVGIRFEYQGLTFFIDKVFNVTEQRSGLRVGQGSRTITEAKNNLKEAIERIGIEKVNNTIESNVKRHGASPGVSS